MIKSAFDVQKRLAEAKAGEFTGLLGDMAKLRLSVEEMNMHDAEGYSFADYAYKHQQVRPYAEIVSRGGMMEKFVPEDFQGHELAGSSQSVDLGKQTFTVQQFTACAFGADPYRSDGFLRDVRGGYKSSSHALTFLLLHAGRSSGDKTPMFDESVGRFAAPLHHEFIDFVRDGGLERFAETMHSLDRFSYPGSHQTQFLGRIDMYAERPEPVREVFPAAFDAVVRQGIIPGAEQQKHQEKERRSGGGELPPL